MGITKTPALATLPKKRTAALDKHLGHLSEQSAEAPPSSWTAPTKRCSSSSPG